MLSGERLLVTPVCAIRKNPPNPVETSVIDAGRRTLDALARSSRLHEGFPTVNYDSALSILKSSFAGGGEGEFYVSRLRQLHGKQIDWLDIGIGKGARSIQPFIDCLVAGGNTMRVIGIDPDAEQSTRDLSDDLSIEIVNERFERYVPTACSTSSMRISPCTMLTTRPSASTNRRCARARGVVSSQRVGRRIVFSTVSTRRCSTIEQPELPAKP